MSGVVFQGFHYTLYWSISAGNLRHFDIHERAYNKSDVQSGVLVRGLDPCETYTFVVQVTAPAEGPLSQPAQHHTGISEFLTLCSHLMVNAWHALCSFIPVALGLLGVYAQRS